MKTNLLITAILIILKATFCSAQQSEIQTIFSDPQKIIPQTKHGIYFVPTQNQVSGMPGMVYGAVIDESLFLGVGGFANLTHTRINSGFAVVQIEYLFSTEKMIHFGYNFSAGIGMVKDYEQKNNLFDNFLNIFGTHYFFGQPGVAVEMNVTKYLQLNFVAGYRFSTGLNEESRHIEKSNLKNRELNGLSFSLSIKLIGD